MKNQVKFKIHHYSLRDRGCHGDSMLGVPPPLYTNLNGALSESEVALKKLWKFKTFKLIHGLQHCAECEFVKLSFDL